VRKIILWGIVAVVAIFLLIQLIPINRTNPPVTREVRWDSEQTRALAQRACFDCHSNKTELPWYSRIAPVSLYLAHHVDEGRSALNFSEWDKPNADIREVQRNIQNGQMPPWDYQLMHPTSKLNSAEQEQLLAGLQATFQQDPPIERRRRFGGD
jgi:hypothetical protein